IAPESPGVAQQPLAPWMTGEHQAVTGEHRTVASAEPLFPVEDLEPGATPPDWARSGAPPPPPPAPPPAPPVGGPPPAPPRGRPAPAHARTGAGQEAAAGPAVATRSNARGSMLVAAGIFL